MALANFLHAKFGGVNELKGKSVYFDGKYCGKRTVFVVSGDSLFNELSSLSTGKEQAMSLLKSLIEGHVQPLIGICSAIPVEDTTVRSLFFLLVSYDTKHLSKWDIVGRWDMKENQSHFSNNTVNLENDVLICFRRIKSSLNSPSSSVAASPITPSMYTLTPGTPGTSLGGDQAVTNVCQTAQNSWEDLVQSDETTAVQLEMLASQIAQTPLLFPMNIADRDDVAKKCIKSHCCVGPYKDSVSKSMWLRFVACFLLESPNDPNQWPTIDWHLAHELVTSAPPQWFFPHVLNDTTAENLLTGCRDDAPLFLVRYAPTEALYKRGCFVFSRFSVSQKCVLHTRLAYHRAGDPSILQTTGLDDYPVFVPIKEANLDTSKLKTAENLECQRFLYVVCNNSTAEPTTVPDGCKCFCWESLEAFKEDVVTQSGGKLKPSKGHTQYS